MQITSLRSATTSTRAGKPLLVAAVLLTALSLSGCSAILQQIKQGTSSTVAPSGRADVFKLKVGDCFNDESASQVSEVPKVPCTTAHKNEIYFSFKLTDSKYPGDSAVSKESDAGCIPPFTSFVGMAEADSDLSVGNLVPTSDSWKSGDREVLCYVSADSDTTGTLKGANH